MKLHTKNGLLPILVLSIPGDLRREYMDKQMKEYDLEFQYIDGVLLDDVYNDKYWLTYLNMDNTKPLSGRKGSKGFTLAWLKMLKYIIDNNIEQSLVLEDDAKFVSGESIKYFIEHVDDYLDKGDIHFIHPQKWYGTQSQIVTLNGAKILYAAREQILYRLGMLLDCGITKGKFEGLVWSHCSDNGLKPVFEQKEPFNTVEFSVRNQIDNGVPLNYKVEESKEFKPRFTSLWSCHHTLTNMDRHCTHLFDRVNKCIEIGCFEGASSRNIVDRLCKKEGSILYCIDPWDDYYEHSTGVSYHGQYDKFNYNIQDLRDKIIPIRGYSQEEVPKIDEMFDFAFIDGCHKAYETYIDGKNVIERMNSGGVIVFDDYLWGNWKVDPENTPKAGIDRFMEEFKDILEIIHVAGQVVVKKK